MHLTPLLQLIITQSKYMQAIQNAVNVCLKTKLGSSNVTTCCLPHTLVRISDVSTKKRKILKQIFVHLGYVK